MANELKSSVPEIQGISTAVDQFTPAIQRLNAAVASALTVEKDVGSLTETINKMPSNTPAEKMLRSYMETQREAMIAQMADSSRKAVNEATAALQMHMRTITELSVQLKGKYGKQEATLKARAANGTSYGNVTDHNRPRLDELLKSRGFVPVFTPLDDGVHYEVEVDGHRGRHVSNIERDWV